MKVQHSDEIPIISMEYPGSCFNCTTKISAPKGKSKRQTIYNYYTRDDVNTTKSSSKLLSGQYQNDHVTKLYHTNNLRPIVVGYAFGPKKMITMGAVMSEASTAVFTVIMTKYDTSYTQHGKNPIIVIPKGSLSDEINSSTSANKNDLSANYVKPSVLRKYTMSRNVPFLDCSQSSKYSSVINVEKKKSSFIPCTIKSFLSQKSCNKFEADCINSESLSTTATDKEDAVVCKSVHNSRIHLTMCPLINYNSSMEVTNSKIQNNIVTSGNIPGVYNILSTVTSSHSHTLSFSEYSDRRNFLTQGIVKDTHTCRNHRISNVNCDNISSTLLSQDLKSMKVSFVPLDLNSPLEEQHGGEFDVILHKMTEDILCLSQLSLTPFDLDNIFISSSLRKGPLCSANENVKQAFQRVERLISYVNKNPSCCLVDHPKQVLALMSRSDIAHALSECLVGITTKTGIPVRTPRYEVISKSQFDIKCLNISTVGKNDRKSDDITNKINSDLLDDATMHKVLKHIENASLTFPLIVKPLTAAGTVESHRMMVVMARSGLKRVQFPCLLQEYANHDEILYKVYVLGDIVKVFPRPSFPNLPVGESLVDSEYKGHRHLEACFEFDSQGIYPKPGDFSVSEKRVKGCSLPTLLAESCFDISTDKHQFGFWLSQNSFNGRRGKDESTVYKLTADEIQPIAETLRRAFGLELFGFDVLVTCLPNNDSICSTECCREMFVVDVNYFPSYKEVQNFPSLLAHYLAKRAIERHITSDDFTK